MSLNIQTSTGLLEISTKVTKEKVISALGYEPADKTHTTDTTLHVTSEERSAWNNKSDFSGVYADLLDAPSITETESGNMIVADENGNIIMQVDEGGVSTTNVSAKTINLDGEDLGERLDSIEAISLPNIVDNESGDLTIADENGNAIMKVDASGLTTTGVTADTLTLAGEDIGTKIDEHISDGDTHVTLAEKETWNNKSDFSGDYNDLINKPNIVDDESGDLTIADENGNAIMKVDASGLTTTGVTADTLTLAGEDIGTKIDEHISDGDTHVTLAEKETWNNKSDFSGDYNDLINKPNIVDDESGEIVYSDNDGYVIAKINASGFETTTVTSKSAVINGVDITTKLDEHKENIDGVGKDLATHTSNTDIHIAADERIFWNNKSDFSGDYNDLINAPDIKEDGSGEVVYTDENGNIIAKIGENGLETTQVIANAIVTNGIDLGYTLSSHVSDTDAHITADERTTWNAKATTIYVDEKVAALVDSSPATLDTLNELAAALGDDPNFATTVAEQIGLKANQTDLDSHISNKSNPHNITATQIGLGNVDNTSDMSKPVSTAQQVALDNLKSELSETIVSESKEWVIADEDGNVVTRVDENGLETTTVTADAIVVNGTDVETTLAGKANNSHIHAISEITDLDSTLDSKAAKTYVDEELAKKSDVSHIHEQYLEAEDIKDLATTEYVDTELAKKSDINHTHEEYLTADDIEDKADKSELHSHENKDELDKIVKGKVAYWDAKSEFSGDYNDLTNAPNIYEDSSNNLVIADPEGNIIFRSDSNGFETTTLTANTVVVNGINVETTLDNKANKSTTLSGYGITDAASRTHTHTITDVVDLQTVLDSKADKTHAHDEYLVDSDIVGLATTIYVDEQLALRASSEHTHEEYLTSEDIINKADISYVNEQLVTKADAEHSHDEYLIANDIANLTTIEYVNEQLLLKSDKEHTHSEYLTINDISTKTDKSYVDDELTKKADKEHSHKEYLVADDIVNKADRSYVDDELIKKAEVNHTHEEYLVDSDIVNKADKSYVDDELAKKSDSGHTHEQYLEAEDIVNKADKSYVDEELAKKVDSAEISHSTETAAESVIVKDGKLSIVVDAYTKAETLNKIQEKITEINGGESAGEVLGALNSYKETNDARVGALDEAYKKADAELTEELAKKLDIADYNSDKSTFVTKDDIVDKADKSELHTHENKEVLDGISKNDIDSWNNKSDFSGAYADLEGAPNITENNSGDLVIADNDGNIIFKSDGAGFETTTLTAQSIFLNGIDVEAKLDAKIDSNALSNYYTKEEIDSLELITVDDIDRICSLTV